MATRCAQSSSVSNLLAGECWDAKPVMRVASSLMLIKAKTIRSQEYSWAVDLGFFSRIPAQEVMQLHKSSDLLNQPSVLAVL